MRISVVVPAYNQACWLPECIESVFHQTLKPHEVLVIDDGSTDDTRQIAERYPVKYIYQANAGVSAARNRGIREATGDWIALLDADDYWLPRKLEAQAAAVTSEGLCYCAATHFFKDGRTADAEYFDVPRALTVLRNRNFIDTSAVLVQREALQKVGGFNETLAAGEDWEAWLKLSRVCGFIGVPERLLRYRVTGTGASTNPESVLRSIDCLVAAGTAGLPPFRRFVEGRRMRSVRTALAALKYRDARKYRETFYYALRAFAWWPSPFYGRAFKLLVLELCRPFRHLNG